MTFQEAQAKFSAIVNSISPTMSSSELVQKQRDLQALLMSLPNIPEFNPIAQAITDFSPKLKGQVTQAVAVALQAQDAVLKEASDLLTQVASKAEANAKILTFEKPKLVAAALAESLAKLKELKEAAKAGDLGATASKAEALLALFESIRATVKEQ